VALTLIYLMFVKLLSWMMMRTRSDATTPSCFAVLWVLPGPQVVATRRGWPGP
jgi:hypothetical protein